MKKRMWVERKNWEHSSKETALEGMRGQNISRRKKDKYAREFESKMVYG